MDILSFLAAPFIASLILTGIHAYLGVHVVERGVIFVDLSLAQIAALGASVAIIYGADPHASTSYWVSLGFTFLGAFIFANVRSKHSRIPQEAIIGICYAVASAATILAMTCWWGISCLYRGTTYSRQACCTAQSACSTTSSAKTF
jgi:zinc/manganese transport system permease protein